MNLLVLARFHQWMQHMQQLVLVAIEQWDMLEQADGALLPHVQLVVQHAVHQLTVSEMLAYVQALRDASMMPAGKSDAAAALIAHAVDCLGLELAKLYA